VKREKKGRGDTLFRTQTTLEHAQEFHVPHGGNLAEHGERDARPVHVADGGRETWLRAFFVEDCYVSPPFFL
jgi:hypothetical protein